VLYEPPEIKYYQAASRFFSLIPAANNRHTRNTPQNNLITKRRGKDDRTMKNLYDLAFRLDSGRET